MKTLPINIKTFDFVEREWVSGKKINNKCGRDFLYYCLHYYFPEKFNKNLNNPLMIDQKKLFGLPVNAKFAGLMIQFSKVPVLFEKLGLLLSINSREIKTFKDFIFAILRANKQSAENAIKEVEKNLDQGLVVGMDISIKFFGLMDHVMFVYGYDENNIYVFDTHQVSGLEYVKITEDNRYIMKLPKDIVIKRWTKFGRVWIVKKHLN